MRKKRKNLKEYYRISDPNKIEAMILQESAGLHFCQTTVSGTPGADNHRFTNVRSCLLSTL
ncbi:MAG: hypothetical protein ACTHME_08295 [Candidatus Nitrosocosmicus sp.]